MNSDIYLKYYLLFFLRLFLSLLLDTPNGKCGIFLYRFSLLVSQIFSNFLKFIFRIVILS